MRRRSIAIILFILAISIAVTGIVLPFTPSGSRLLGGITQADTTASSSAVPVTLTPFPTPTPILTAQGKPPTVSATAAYLYDADTGHALADINGEKLLPMASTTKIMTAIIAIQTADLDEIVTIQQDAYNEVHLHNGSFAGLVVDDKITLRDLLYGLMLPSGDDAAIAIADTVGGSTANFVNIMNLFAHRLHLYQTHYTNPDGLTPDGEVNPNHYTTALDLVRLTQYAMSVPLLAKIVQTKHYELPPIASHHGYTWDNTNTLLGTYSGITGVKTGHTEEAGYCLVFSATHGNHHLIGVVLQSPDSDSRFKDAKTLLDWGFALPLRSLGP
jgi:serine-type D-Ala-D-Ala carboxypeptidase (penicillin-binding protein 5/6)